MKKYLFIYGILLQAYLMAACTSDTGKGYAPPGTEGTPVTVSLSVVVPGSNVVPARALEDGDETEVREIDILVFDELGKYMYRARTSAPSGEGSVKTFEASLYSSDKARWVHLIANARAAVDAATLTKGMSEEEVLVQFEAQVVNSPAVAMGHPFTMWGKKVFPAIPATGIPDSDDRRIKLMRSVARIDIGLNYENGGDGPNPSPRPMPGFQLTYAQVYNAHSKGRVAPANNNLSGDGASVVRPTTVTGNTTVNYGAVNADSPSDNCIHNSIYVFEKNVASEAECITLVIGGRYGGDTQDTYYKLLLRDANDASGYLTILRNHLYRINIVEVTGRGHSTVQLALDNLPVGVRADIIVEDAGMAETVFDEQHHLSVDRSSFYFYRENKSAVLKVQTNHGDGFSLAGKPDWMTLDRTSGPGGATVSITLSPDSYPPSVSNRQDRSATLVISAGRLRKEISITQSYLPELTLTIDPKTLVFFSNGNPQSGGTKDITVTTFSTEPSLEILKFEIVPGGSWSAPGDFVEFPPASISRPTGTSGTYSIQPRDGGGREKESRVKVTLSYNNGEREVTDEVIVRQMNINSLFLPSANNPYPSAGGNNQTYTVVSELPWRARLRNAGNPMFTAFDTSVHSDPVSTGTFSLSANNSYVGRSETIDFQSPTSDPSFAPVPLLIEQAGDPLHMTFTNPESRIVDLGIAGSPKAVRFMVNSNWALKEVNDPLGLVVSKTYNGADIPQLPSKFTGGTPNNPKTVDMVVTGRVLTGTPFYTKGSVLTASLVFTTQDTPSGIEPVEQQLSLRQEVFGWFDYRNTSPATGSTLPRTGAVVTINAAANAAWYAACSLDMAKTYSLPYLNTGVRSLAVPIPDNNTGAVRDLNILTLDAATNTWVVRASFKQSGT